MTTSKAATTTTTTNGGAIASKAGEIFAAHVAGLLATEFDRRKTLEARGGTIITTSAALLALIVAMIALLVGKDFKLENAAAGRLVMGSLAAFVVANVLAILVQNYALAYTVTANETLDDMIGRRWFATEDDARRVCAKRQVNTIKSLRHGNTWKARLAYASLACEVIAIALLASSAATELYMRSNA